MKRCSECRRDYYDDSLLYCLDDGTALLEGPAANDAVTVILPDARVSSEAATRTFDSQLQTPNTNDTASGRNSVIAGAIGVLLVTALAVGSYLFYGRSPARQIGSIAVMPFVNAAGNPDLEYLSDGITESLINSLSQVPALSVKARSSVFTYKGKDVSTQQIAKDLSVDAVLNGRVQQRGDQVLLNIELVDATTGNQIWGDKYTRTVADLVQLQSDIARDVSSKLKSKLSGDEQQKIAKNYTDNTEAYQLYLKGRYHWNKRRSDDILRSIDYFQQAIDKDPTYGLAYASLAEAYILIPSYRIGAAKEYYPKARAAAVKAIEIDDSLAEAHNALASVTEGFDWKFTEAEAEWQKAIELNPSYATAHQWYGEHLLNMGRYGEALAEMRRAEQLDPLSLIISGLLGVTLGVNGQPELALGQLNKTLEMDPNFARTHLFLAETYQSMGRYEEAIDEFEKHFKLIGMPPDAITALATNARQAYRSGGAKGFSRAMAETIRANSSPTGAPVTVLAGYWAGAGEFDKAFDLMEKAYVNHDDSLLLLKHSRLDPLKSDPRYKDLLRRVGLPE